MRLDDPAAALPLHVDSHGSLLRGLPEVAAAVRATAAAGRRRPAAPRRSAGAQPAASAAATRTLDAVVVPATGPVHRLGHVLELAAGAGSRLVVLCSGGARAAQVLDAAGDAPRGPAVVAVDVPDGFSSELLRFATSWHVEAASHRTGDLSLKRNLALLLGRMLGWRRVLLLQDDVQGLHGAQLAAMASLLGPCRAVGAPARETPDLSVVGHAHRLAGGRQDVFLSGAALAVDPTTADTFFPEVYRDDWLFLHAGLRDGTVGAVGEVSRGPEDPFADPGRATAEQFGDTLGEGLLTLLHAGAPTEVDSGYWKGLLRRRRLFLADIERRLDLRAYDDEPPRPQVYDALAAAERRLGEISAWDLESYVGCWWDDLRLWRERLAGLPRATSVEQALGTLGLSAPVPVGTR